MSQIEADRILDALEQEVVLCDELAALRREQRGLIDAGEYAAA